MDQPVSFAKPFAELVRLLAERGDVAAQKAALRACLVPLKRGTITMATSGDDLVVAGAALPTEPDATGLARRIAARGVATIAFETDALPGDVLATARWLAGEPLALTLAADAGPPPIANLRTVRIAMRAAADGVDGAPRRPSRAVPTVEPGTAPGRRRSTRVQAIAEETGPGRRRSTRVQAIAEEMERRKSTAVVAIGASPSASALLDTLDAATSPEARAMALASIAGAIDAAIRAADGESLADLGEGLIAHTGPEVAHRDAVLATLRPVLEPAPLRLVAHAAVTSPARIDGVVAVLARAGESGAAIVIARVLQAKTLAERHAHFGTLIKLPAASAVLSRMLADGRWYVARNAADLLGELHAREAEVVLGAALGHADERVRRAAANALSKLGTPGAIQALGAALRDPSPLVRVQVASGLAGRKGTKSATTLSRALDDEGDVEVQLAILAALGRVGNAEAVTRLTKAAEPDGRLFKKKPVAVRVAAVHALGEARTPAALAVLQSLAHDKEREVREAVLRVVVQAQRGEPADLS